VKQLPYFWCVVSEFLGCEEGRQFSHWLVCIAEAFRDGDLYGLKVVETDAMYTNGSREAAIFMAGCRFISYHASAYAMVTMPSCFGCIQGLESMGLVLV
jgi:hypothetical protein